MKSLIILVLLLGTSVSIFSQNTNKTVFLVGKVYSELGEGLEGAKVKATGKDGVSFETLTDGNGSYKLELPVRVLNKELTVRNSEISAYDIRVELKGFLVSELVNFKLVLPESGAIRVDLALEVGLH